MLIVQTPLRISFAGGGTDMQEFYKHEPGMVISATIHKYVYIVVNPRYDDEVVINYSRKERVSDITKIEHRFVREALILTNITRAVEITCLADIPAEGSGLGSSASFAIGLLNALYHYKGIQVTAEHLAREATFIEVTKLGRPVGKQDQYAAAYGNMNVFTFNEDESVERESVFLSASSLAKFSSSLLLFYTNVTRNSETILAEQKNNIKTAKNREVLSKMKQQVPEIRDALISNDFNKVGRLLHEGWQSKKSLASKVSTPEIDRMYAKAIEAGAIGGKISGAGGGGFLLLYVPLEKQESVRQALRGYREMLFRIEREGSKTIFNAAANPWLK